MLISVEYIAVNVAGASVLAAWLFAIVYFITWLEE